MENLVRKKHKVLITGHSGFKGSWLSLFLKLQGYELYGISLKNRNKVNLIDELIKKKVFKKSYYIDIKSNLFLKKIKQISPETIFHLASQSLVSESFEFPKNTINTNIVGTQNLLEAIRITDSIKSVLFVTSDKVYKNEKNIKFIENSSLGGDDIYSVSKSMQDLLINAYYKTFFLNRKISFAILRAGNVLGGGDWSKNRIMVDIMKSLFLTKKLTIRSLKSTRPWISIFDIINGYYLAFKYINNKKKGIFIWNFGPSEKISKVEDLIKYLKIITSDFNRINIKSIKNNLNEKKSLKLNTNKSKKELSWNQKIRIFENLNITYEWYFHFFNNKKNIYEYSKEQLHKYI